MTEPSNFEDVPVNMPGRPCQDDSTRGGYFSVLECVPVSSGAAPDLGLATSVSWVSSSVVYWYSIRSSLSSLRNSGFQKVSRFKELQEWTLPVSRQERRLLRCESGEIAPSCSVQRSLSLLRNTLCKSSSFTFVPTLVSLAIAASGPPPLTSAKKHHTLIVPARLATTVRRHVRLLFACRWTPNIVPLNVLAQEHAESIVANDEGPSRPIRAKSTSSRNSSRHCNFLLLVRCSPSLSGNVQTFLVSRLKALSRVNTNEVLSRVLSMAVPRGKRGTSRSYRRKGGDPRTDQTRKETTRTPGWHPEEKDA